MSKAFDRFNATADAMNSQNNGPGTLGHLRPIRIYYYFFAVITGIDVGIAVRFWKAVLTPPQPFIDDWSGPIYFLVGFLWSAVALQMTRMSWKLYPQGKLIALCVILNGLCFVHYLGLFLWVVWSAFAQAGIA